MGLLSKVGKIAVGAGAGFLTGGPAGAAVGAYGGYAGAREREKQKNQEKDAKEAVNAYNKQFAYDAAGKTGKLSPQARRLGRSKKDPSGALPAAPLDMAGLGSLGGFVLLLVVGAFLFSKVRG